MFFFFNDTATTEIYTLSLHDALPILGRSWQCIGLCVQARHRLRCKCIEHRRRCRACTQRDRKSTRLNSSHTVISDAVFCLKKKISHLFTSLSSRYKNSSDIGAPDSRP